MVEPWARSRANIPVHRSQSKTITSASRQAQDRYHQSDESTSNTPNRDAELPQVPGSRSKPVTHEEHPDEDGRGKGDEGSQRADAEDGTDGEIAAEDQQEQAAADGVIEPDGVDGRVGHGVDVFPVS